jgi:thioredoxin 1
MNIEKKTAKYFSAPWCGPCQMYAPVVDELMSQGYQITKINVDEEMQLAQEYGVMSVPTIVIENTTGVTDILQGVYSREELIQRLS